MEFWDRNLTETENDEIYWKFANIMLIKTEPFFVSAGTSEILLSVYSVYCSIKLGNGKNLCR